MDCYTFEKKVREYINKNHMAQRGEHLIVGVSGGADSLCLLEILYRLSVEMKWKITVVHVHHGIRGQEADEDEQFVKEFCKKRSLVCECFHYDIPLEAKTAKEGEEEAGRRLRYQALEEVRQKYSADKIVLAHHQDDQAETILFHLIRGSGLKGLCGIQPVNGNKIRPLLCTNREEICRYLKEQGISYRTDQSNFSEKYARNRLRLRVVPLLEEVNERAVENISRAAGQILETEKYLEGQTLVAAARMGLYEADGAWKEIPFYLEKEKYEKEAFLIRRRVLYRMLCEIAGSSKNLQERHVLSVDALFSKQSGRRVELPYGMRARRDNFGVWMEKKQTAGKEKKEIPLFSKQDQERISSAIDKHSHCLPLSGRRKLTDQGNMIEWKVFFWEKNGIIPKNNYTKWFDYAKISTAALFRTRRAGDWFVMDSLGRRKKLKQYFIDEKIPGEQREKQLLFADGSHIIWIVGGRISEEYKVRETTRIILEVKCVKKERYS